MNIKRILDASKDDFSDAVKVLNLKDNTEWSGNIDNNKVVIKKIYDPKMISDDYIFQMDIHFKDKIYSSSLEHSNSKVTENQLYKLYQKVYSMIS